MYSINSYVMAIHMPNGSTVVTPDRMALKERVARLKRELKNNLNKTNKG